MGIMLNGNPKVRYRKRDTFATFHTVKKISPETANQLAGPIDPKPQGGLPQFNKPLKVLTKTEITSDGRANLQNGYLLPEAKKVDFIRTDLARATKKLTENNRKAIEALETQGWYRKLDKQAKKEVRDTVIAFNIPPESAVEPPTWIKKGKTSKWA